MTQDSRSATSGTLKHDVVRGLKWTAGAKLAGQGVTWAMTLVVMRLLVPDDYGLLAMSMVSLSLLALFGEIGLGPALIQAREMDVAVARRALGVIVLTNLVLFALLNLCAPLIALFYREPRLVSLLHALSLQFLLAPYTVMADVFMQRQLEYRRRSLIDLSVALVTGLATLSGALLHLGVWALVGGYLFGIAWRAGCLCKWAPFPHWPDFSLAGVRQLMSYGSHATGSRVLWFVFTQADSVIVGRWLGEAALGAYSVSMHLASLPVQRISSIVNQVSFPAFARYQHETELVRALVLKAVRLIALFAFPILWGMASVTSDLVLCVLGPHWGVAVFPLQALCIIMPLRTVAGFLPTITDAMGRPQVAFRNALLGCVVMPAAFLIGTRWGIFGVALAWLTAYPVVMLVNLGRMLGALGIARQAFAMQLAPSVLNAMAMVGAVLAVHALLPGPAPPLRLAIEVTAGALIYSGLTFKWNAVAVGQLRDLIAMR